jgi:hypothetical protein
MGEAKRRRLAGTLGNQLRSGITVNEQLLTRIAALASPHREATFKALITAFPDNNEYPALLYASVIACQLAAVLHIAGGAVKDISKILTTTANQKRAITDINWLLTVTADKENNYRLIAMGQNTDDGNLGTMTNDDQLWKRIIEVSQPHMHALWKAITAAFPGNKSINMHGIAFACELSWLLNGISSIDRSHTVNTINMTLTMSGCMLRSNQTLERMLDQRDRELYDQGGLPGVVYKLIRDAETRQMGPDGIACHLFPDLSAPEQAALSGIIHRSIEAWSAEAPENPTHH